MSKFIDTGAHVFIAETGEWLVIANAFELPDDPEIKMGIQAGTIEEAMITSNLTQDIERHVSVLQYQLTLTDTGESFVVDANNDFINVIDGENPGEFKKNGIGHLISDALPSNIPSSESREGGLGVSQSVQSGTYLVAVSLSDDL